MAEAIIYLFDSPSKRRQDGRFPVVLKVTHDRQRKYFSTKLAGRPDQWDFEAGRFTKSFKGYKDANATLQTIQEKATKIIKRLEVNEEPFSFPVFESAFLSTKEKTTLDSYFSKWIARLEKENRIGTAAPYRQTISALSQFRKDAKDMKLQDISYKFVIDFEHYLRTERGLKDTSISVYMRTLRALLNKAIREGLMKREHYPFDKYRLSEHLNETTAKRAITKDAVKTIEALVLPDKSPLKFAQDVFLFSYYTRGMNFVDIANLTPANIEGNTLKYTRSKTGKPFAIGLLPQAKQIIEHYQQHQRPGGYIFPVFNDDVHKTAKQKVTRRKTALRDVNRNLKTIAEMAGLEGLKLTSYVSRHTYATTLKQAGTNTAYISEALGHQTEKITQVYLKSFGDDVLNEIDKNVL